ncbi:MAG: aminotransferase class V-fold PLP-dependent enzyme [Gemmataceae bacterium]|nr:aminotransferase class V-fold PLP-dependent enzyme [Gemmata sp.]MDW8199361.1 aminotransferase class V-fold PLP-dependent enzyme [Gemmataceae bacterium]
MSLDRPALLGGIPVRPQGPPSWPLPDPDVRHALEAAIAAGAWGHYQGEQVSAFESELATYHNVPYALSCASGTLAVEVALRALRLGPGDEVLLAAYDYEANFLTIHAIGAKPVLVDVDPVNWQLDPNRLAAAITASTKAIICTHLHGGQVPMRDVLAFARRRGLAVVEDAAQAIGAVVDGRAAGTWGDVGILSFGGSKLLCAGRGGALLFQDAILFQRAKTWLHRGIQAWAALSELQAAALRPQLRQLSASTHHRWQRVQQLLNDLKTVALDEMGHRQPTLPSGTDAGDAPDLGLVAFAPPANSVPAFYKLGFRYDAARFGLPRDIFIAAMRAEGIAFDGGFRALHVGRSPARFRAGSELTHATQAHHGCVILHHPVLSCNREDVRQVAEAIRKVYRYRNELRHTAAGSPLTSSGN